MKKCHFPAIVAGILIFTCLMLIECSNKNEVAVPRVTLTGVNDSLFRPGDTIKVFGTGFLAQSGLLVSLAGASLPIFSLNDREVHAMIPVSARSGALSISFSKGPAITSSSLIRIIVTGEPIITLLTPSNVAIGDTLIIQGKNFATVFNLNNVTIGGAESDIINVTSSQIKTIVPGNAQSGSLVVTSNGLTSLPASINVEVSSPLADGRIYWIVPYRNYSIAFAKTPFANILYRGNDGNVPPFGDPLLRFENFELSQSVPGTKSPGNVYDGSVLPKRFNQSNIVTDGGGNAYYLNYENGSATSALVSLVKLTTKPALQRTIIWSRNFAASEVGSTLLNNVQVPNFPSTRLSIQGDFVYVKLGLTNDFYVINVSGLSPSFSRERINFPSANTYGPAFTQSYEFYGIARFDPRVSSGTVTTLRYAQRGSPNSDVIPLPTGESIIDYAVDPRGGDNLVISTTRTQFQDLSVKISDSFYKFNAGNGQLVRLYSEENWIDANSIGDANLGDQNQGFTWAGHSIYYVSKSRKLNRKPASGLFRLKDDGSSLRPESVYSQLDADYPGSTQYSFIPFFIDVTQAKP